MDAENRLPFLRFASAGLPHAERFDALRSVSAPFFHVEPTEAGLRDPDAAIDTWLLHDAVLSTNAFGAALIARPERRRGAAAHGFVALHRYIHGWLTGLVDDAPFAHRGAALMLIDGGAAMRFASSRLSALNVMLPYDAVGYDPSRHPAYLPVDLATPIGRVLDAALWALFEAAPTLPGLAARDRAEGLAALVRALLRLAPLDDRGRHEVGAAQRLAMRAWIDARLAGPGLVPHERAPAGLARAFGVSRRTVYRLFEDVGGVDNYVRRRRLEGAMRDLLAAEPGRGAVRRAAERWGFDDPSHFHRRFRAAFGVAPRDALHCDAPPMPPPADAPLRAWLAARHGGGAG